MGTQARKALERDLDRRRHDPVAAPPRGWVRAIRDALGMSAAELGTRLGVSHQAVTQLERAEATGGVTLEKLEEVARGLGCRLEYVLVPDRPLDEMVTDRARAKARRILESVGHTMALEGQQVDLDDEVDEMAASLVDRRGLWSDG